MQRSRTAIHRLEFVEMETAIGRRLRRQDCLWLCVSRGRKQAYFRMPRVKSRMLDDDQHIGFENGRVVGIAWNGRGIF